MKNFILIGAAGYIAPRHLKAIKDTGNNLLAALDKHDSVGILDSYFPEADFFTEFERFDRHVEKLRHNGVSIDFLSVCSPNYLHDAHIRFGLRSQINVICEKPVVLNPWNLDALLEAEKETGKKTFTILQLRYHPAIVALKNEIVAGGRQKRYKLNLTYITPRGHWYMHSWKGDLSKSGGIATNIGLHFFDMLLWIFGDVQESEVFESSSYTSSGRLLLEQADVEWFLSIDERHLPVALRGNSRSYRSLIIDGRALDFSEGFTDLHTFSYQEILSGRGFRLAEAKKTIALVQEIRDQLK